MTIHFSNKKLRKTLCKQWF